MAVLVLADHDLGRLSPSTARTVAAAATLGDVDLLVLGEGVDAVATDAASLSGVSRVLVGQDTALLAPTAEALVPILARLAERYSHLVATANAVGKDVWPRLAARLDVMPVTDVTAILGPDRFERPIYAGNAVETVVSTQAPQVISVRASAFAPAARGGPAPIEPLALEPVDTRITIIGAHRTETDAPDLSTARIVVAGGVSLGSRENFRLIEDLAKTLGAAVGATRAAVDAGFAPNDWQVGQTGKVIAPDLYIAVGISGALQHLAGIQGARTIVAIDKNAETPLMQLADIGLVGDLFTVLPELTRALGERKA